MGIKKHLKVLMMTFCIVFSTHAFAEPLRLATLEWPPYYGKDLPSNGFYSAIAREAYKRAGYEIDIVFLPWKRALEDARRGKYDGLLGAYFTDERAQYFLFTEVIYSNDEVFVQKKGAGIAYTQPEDLKSYKIGGVRGSAQIEAIKALGLIAKETTDSAQNLKKLATNRIDLVVIGRANFLHILKEADDPTLQNSNFDILNPPFKTYDIHSVISKANTDGAVIVDKFNEALQEMKNDGSYDRILKEHGML